MMHDDIPREFWYAIAGGIGGFARLAMGIRDDGTTIKGEAFRVFIISMPMGMFAAQYAADSGYEQMAFAVGYLVGISSLNTARMFATEGLKGVLSILFRLK